MIFELSETLNVATNGLKIKQLCLRRCSRIRKMVNSSFVNVVFNWMSGLHHMNWGLHSPLVNLLVLFASVAKGLLDFFVNYCFGWFKKVAGFCALAFSAFVYLFVKTFRALVENFNKSTSSLGHTVVDNGSPQGFLMIQQIAVVEKVCKNKLSVVLVAGMFVVV